MRGTLSLSVTAVVALLAIAPAGAQSTGMKNGSANADTVARCSPGDPNVIVDTKTRTFTLDKAANKKAMHSKDAGSMAKMSDASASSTAATSTMKSMCKSEAQSMGAKMASGSASKKGGS